MKKQIINFIALLLFVSLSSNRAITANPVPVFVPADGSIEDIAKKIIGQMNNEQYSLVRDQLSETVKAQLTTVQIKEAWVGMLLQFGKIVSFERPSTTEVQGYKKVTQLINYQNGKATFDLVFDGSNQIVVIWLKPVQ